MGLRCGVRVQLMLAALDGHDGFRDDGREVRPPFLLVGLIMKLWHTAQSKC